MNIRQIEFLANLPQEELSRRLGRLNVGQILAVRGDCLHHQYSPYALALRLALVKEMVYNRPFYPHQEDE